MSDGTTSSGGAAGRAVIEEPRRALLPQHRRVGAGRGGRDGGDSARCRRGTRRRGASARGRAPPETSSSAAAARLSLQRAAAGSASSGLQGSDPLFSSGKAARELSQAAVAFRRCSGSGRGPWRRRRSRAHRRLARPARAPRRETARHALGQRGIARHCHQLVLPQVHIPLGKLCKIRRVRHGRHYIGAVCRKARRGVAAARLRHGVMLDRNAAMLSDDRAARGTEEGKRETRRAAPKRSRS